MAPTNPLSLRADEAFQVKGQRVIVTGAAGWIGRTIAEAFVTNGAAVLLSDLPTPALEEAATRLAASGTAASCGADLQDLAQLDNLVAAACRTLGGIDSLINCGGIASSPPLVAETSEQFTRMLNTNLRSAWHLTRAVRPAMVAAGGGSIVNIASINGHRATFPCPSYASAKAGLLALTRETAVELAPDRIRVNSISPGFIGRVGREEHWLAWYLAPAYHDAVRKTVTEYLRSFSNAQPLPVPGTPADVALACVYLCAPASRFMTGADLLMDGGLLQEMPDYEPRHREGRALRERLRLQLMQLPPEAWLRKPVWLRSARGDGA